MFTKSHIQSIHSNTIHNSPKLETIQMPVSCGVFTQWEWTTDNSIQHEQSHSHTGEQNKPVTKYYTKLLQL